MGCLKDIQSTHSCLLVSFYLFFSLTHSTQSLTQSHPSSPPHTTFHPNRHTHTQQKAIFCSDGITVRPAPACVCVRIAPSQRDKGVSVPPSRCVLFHLVEMNALYQITHLKRCMLQSRQFTGAACETSTLLRILDTAALFERSYTSKYDRVLSSCFILAPAMSSDGEVKGERRDEMPPSRCYCEVYQNK